MRQERTAEVRLTRGTSDAPVVSAIEIAAASLGRSDGLIFPQFATNTPVDRQRNLRVKATGGPRPMTQKPLTRLAPNSKYRAAAAAGGPETLSLRRQPSREVWLTCSRQQRSLLSGETFQK